MELGSKGETLAENLLGVSKVAVVRTSSDISRRLKRLGHAGSMNYAARVDEGRVRVPASASPTACFNLVVYCHSN